MKNTIMWVLSNFFLFSLMAQSAQLDSLIALTSAENKEAVWAYKHLALLHTDTLEQHIYYARKGISLAQKLNEDLLEANILMNLGGVHDIHGQMDRAIEIFDSSLVLFEALEDVDDWIVSLYINYGAAYYYGGLKNISVDYWLKAYDMAIKDTSNQNYNTILNNISVIYDEIGNHSEAQRFFVECIRLKNIRKDHSGAATSMMNLGLSYKKAGKYNEALEILEQAASTFKSIRKNDEIIARLYQASVWVEKGDYKRAEEIIRPHLRDTFGDLYPSRKIELLKLAGDVFMFKKEYTTAKEYYELSNLYMDKGSFQFEKQAVLDSLAIIYSTFGDFRTAYNYVADSKEILAAETEKNRILSEQEMLVRFNTLEREQENMRLEQKNAVQLQNLKRSRRNLVLSLLALLALSVFALQTYLTRRKIKLLNTELRNQKETIQKALSEKEILLKEIHHRVKNNLQVISSLLGIQSRKVKDEATQEAINIGRARVQSMSLIHEDLYSKNNLTGVAIKSYYEKLSQNLLSTYATSHQEVQLHSDIDDITLDVDTMIPLGLVLNELITNALKYAFPNDGGDIFISIKEQDNGLLLSVKDNGIGLKKDLTDKDHDSFGFELIRAFVRKLEGEMQIINQHGTEVRAILKAYKKAA